MGELSKSSTFTMLLYSSSLPLLLSPLCECLVDPPSKIFVSRRSTFQFQLFTVANSGTGIEQTTDFSQIWKKLARSSPRDLVFHVSVTFGMRICSTIFKVFGTRATPGSVALAIDFAQPPLGLRRPREGTRGGGKMRHRVSLEIRLQIYSSRSTRR